MRRWLGVLLAGAVSVAFAQTLDRYGRVPGSGYQGDEEEKPWQELGVEPPAFPKQENLKEFYVSPVATNKYFIDASTLAVGADGVVRYVLVVKTSGGATNVSFEGIRCEERTWKHYATGRSDGATWTTSRAARNDWRPIENKPVNRHHAALSRDLFCPSGSAIQTADEGRNALRLGKHPNAN
jgi:hypothetical protein